MHRIIIASKSIGFCGGVANAVTLAKQFLDKHNQFLYSIGSIIHNEIVISQLSEKGLITVEKADEIPNNSTVLIRAHGCESSTLDLLKEKNCKLIDATCPSVKIIHKNVLQYSNNGFQIIIYGNPNHPEVKGIASIAKNAVIIEDINDFTFLTLSDKFYIVFQTTFSTKDISYLLNNLQSIAIKDNKSVDIFNSICYTTLARRDSCSKVLSLSDVMIILGDKASNNTVELYNIARANCNKVYFISNLDELNINLKEIMNNKNIGIFTGASTPNGLVLEVIKLMKEESTNIEIVDTDESNTNNEVNIRTPEVNSSDQQNEFMDKVMSMPVPNNSKQLNIGDIKSVHVVAIDDEGRLQVSYGDGSIKNDLGIIEKDEIDPDADIKEGDDILAVVINTEQKHQILFSHIKCVAIIKEEEKIELLKQGHDVELKCTGVNRNETKLLCEVGRYKVFVPKSKIELNGVKGKLDQYIGKTLTLRLLTEDDEEPKEGTKKHIKSNKVLHAGQKEILQEKEDAFWNEVAVVGNVVKGTVVRFGKKNNHPFGAFVSVNGHDCLAHISELSWNRIKDPSEVLTEGEEYDFIVKEADRATNKVSLSYRELQKSPIEIIEEKYPVGSTVEGKVERIMPFGAFVSMGENIDGLVHISQIAHQRVEDINDFLKVGDTIKAKVTKYDKNKISLSIKELIEKPEHDENRLLKNKLDKEAVKVSREESKAKPKTKKKENNNDSDSSYISSTTTGATFGDTEQGQKLFKQLQEDKNNK
ncbi:MAG TPA: 4-hydroxy-3-methylbut-2-enyl diphosphate reductase [Clostridia bacterium]|jgi:4-hydroxy-3-methylbut-2-enyl diphosphate reductase|nr:4-hydroxy-3-methylbut-2-enyl diphosphate reductase [Clostridia bacterium]